jgi:uncharacterized protein (UPF0262 family)
MRKAMTDQSEPVAGKPGERLYEVTLDPGSIARGNPNIEHEREVAIFDLIDQNSFALAGRSEGPYRLRLAVVDDRLMMTIGNAASEALEEIAFSMMPLRRIMKDYFLVCDSYYQAIRTAPPSRIQAIDIGRRSLHDEGSKLLAERLAGRLSVDHDTARRLFTLVCTLHWKG